MYDLYSVVDFDVILPNTARTVLQEKPRARSGAEKWRYRACPLGWLGEKRGSNYGKNTDKVGFK